MENAFFGRDDLMSDLLTLWHKRVSSFVTCRGRRRIGKSTLIERFAMRSGARFIKLEGLRPKAKMTACDELANFANQLAIQTGAETTVPQNWLSAFVRLERELDDKGRTVILLDEVSWMAHGDLTFAGTLKIAWDNYFKKHPKLVFVVCGSVSTWIKENIIDEGSFYGRRSLDIVVPELPLSECVKFWGRAVERIDAREIIDILSVTGGVPRYLEEIDPGVSANENIRRLCFRPKAILREDFDEMFRDVVSRLPTLTASIVRALVDGSLTSTEVAERLGKMKGGNVSAALDQLVEVGMVAADVGKNPVTGAAARMKLYRLKDNYCRFYLKYIEPEKEAIDKGVYTLGSLDQLDGWQSVLGLAFENMVVNNTASLLQPLGLASSLVVSATPYRKAGRGNPRGLQIDLLLQTRRSVCLVEVKRQREIGREVIDEMAEKVRRLPRRDGLSVRTALVYEGHLSPIVEADGYFDAIIPFRRLMGL
ncbi:MAG: hypothetical protein J5985_02335 [Kiritimatiellae bacterium]|nr:hypothetical protein [Kiritimatiellia bacterium]